MHLCYFSAGDAVSVFFSGRKKIGVFMSKQDGSKGVSVVHGHYDDRVVRPVNLAGRTKVVVRSNRSAPRIREHHDRHESKAHVKKK